MPVEHGKGWSYSYSLTHRFVEAPASAVPLAIPAIIQMGLPPAGFSSVDNSTVGETVPEPTSLTGLGDEASLPSEAWHSVAEGSLIPRTDIDTENEAVKEFESGAPASASVASDDDDDSWFSAVAPQEGDMESLASVVPVVLEPLSPLLLQLAVPKLPFAMIPRPAEVDAVVRRVETTFASLSGRQNSFSLADSSVLGTSLAGASPAESRQPNGIVNYPQVLLTDTIDTSRAGSGKSVLAAAACRSEELSKLFGQRMYWVSCTEFGASYGGKSTVQAVRVLQLLIDCVVENQRRAGHTAVHHVSPEAFCSVEECQCYLRLLLSAEAVRVDTAITHPPTPHLLVLDGVQSQVEVDILGTLGLVTLITSRSKEVQMVAGDGPHVVRLPPFCCSSTREKELVCVSIFKAFRVDRTNPASTPGSESEELEDGGTVPSSPIAAMLATLQSGNNAKLLHVPIDVVSTLKKSLGACEEVGIASISAVPMIAAAIIQLDMLTLEDDDRGGAWAGDAGPLTSPIARDFTTCFEDLATSDILPALCSPVTAVLPAIPNAIHQLLVPLVCLLIADSVPTATGKLPLTMLAALWKLDESQTELLCTLLFRVGIMHLFDKDDGSAQYGMIPVHIAEQLRCYYAIGPNEMAPVKDVYAPRLLTYLMSPTTLFNSCVGIDRCWCVLVNELNYSMVDDSGEMGDGFGADSPLSEVLEALYVSVVTLQELALLDDDCHTKAVASLGAMTSLLEQVLRVLRYALSLSMAVPANGERLGRWARWAAEWAGRVQEFKRNYYLLRSARLGIDGYVDVSDASDANLQRSVVLTSELAAVEARIDSLLNKSDARAKLSAALSVQLRLQKEALEEESCGGAKRLSAIIGLARTIHSLGTNLYTTGLADGGTCHEGMVKMYCDLLELVGSCVRRDRNGLAAGQLGDHAMDAEAIGQVAELSASIKACCFIMMHTLSLCLLRHFGVVSRPGSFEQVSVTVSTLASVVHKGTVPTYVAPEVSHPFVLSALCGHTQLLMELFPCLEDNRWSGASVAPYSPGLVVATLASAETHAMFSPVNTGVLASSCAFNKTAGAKQISSACPPELYHLKLHYDVLYYIARYHKSNTLGDAVIAGKYLNKAKNTAEVLLSYLRSQNRAALCADSGQQPSDVSTGACGLVACPPWCLIAASDLLMHVLSLKQRPDKVVALSSLLLPMKHDHLRRYRQLSASDCCSELPFSVSGPLSSLLLLHHAYVVMAVASIESRGYDQGALALKRRINQVKAEECDVDNVAYYHKLVELYFLLAHISVISHGDGGTLTLSKAKVSGTVAKKEIVGLFKKILFIIKQTSDIMYDTGPANDTVPSAAVVRVDAEIKKMRKELIVYKKDVQLKLKALL